MSGASQTRAYLALLLIVALWSSYPATAKLALRDVSPFFLVTARCLIASAFLLGLLRRAPLEPGTLAPATLRAFAVLGLAGIVVSTQLTYIAIHYTTAGNATILQAATPVMVALGARFYLKERLRPGQWLGVAASAFGVLLVVTGGRLGALRPEELRAGDFIALGAMAGWAAYTVYGSRVLAAHSPLLTTAAAYVLGTLVLVPIAVATAPLFPPPRLGSPVAWVVVLYQALLGAVAHIGWYEAVEVVGPSRSAVFMNLQPLLGLALAAGLLGERIGSWQLAGVAFVLLGVALVTRPAARRRGAPEGVGDAGAPARGRRRGEPPRPTRDGSR